MKSLKLLVMTAVLAWAASGVWAEDPAPKSKPEFGFGIQFGNVTINGTNYNQIRMQPDLDLGKFGIGLDLNLEFDANGQIRTEEWTSWQAILAKITYIRYGKKFEKPVYVKLGGIDDFTLGHGQIVYQYNNMLNYPNVKKLGLAFDLDLKFAGLESMVDNVLDWDILGLRVYGRPLINLGIPIIKSLEIGASYVADLDPQNQVSNISPYLFSDNPASVKVGVWGLDLGAIILKNFAVEMLAYADFVAIEGKGTGEILGVAGKLISVIPYRLEVQFLQDRFITRYFDTFYDGNRAALYNSLDSVTNSAGLLFSSGLSLLDDKLAFLFTIRDAFTDDILPELQFDFKLSKDLLKKVGFTFSWYRKDIFYFTDIFKFEDVNSVMMTELQYMVSDNLALIINYKRTFELDSTGAVIPFTSTSISTKMSF